RLDEARLDDQRQPRVVADLDRVFDVSALHAIADLLPELLAVDAVAEVQDVEPLDRHGQREDAERDQQVSEDSAVLHCGRQEFYHDSFSSLPYGNGFIPRGFRVGTV